MRKLLTLLFALALTATMASARVAGQASSDSKSAAQDSASKKSHAKNSASSDMGGASEASGAKLDINSASKDELKSLLADQAYHAKELEQLESDWLEQHDALEQITARI